MRKRDILLLAWLVATGLPSVALAGKVGPEFQVNTYTTDDQAGPSVASDANGNFVVVWRSSSDQYPNPTGIFGQRYDSSGDRLGGEFQVNSDLLDGYGAPRVASDASGDFVVVWGYGRGQQYFLRGARYDSNGNHLGEFFIAANPGYPRSASVASDDSGNFVVVWQQQGPGYSYDFNVFAQRYDGQGNPVGSQFQVNSHTTDDQVSPSIASDPSGNFLVVWESDQQDGGGIFGQRYENSGNRLGAEFQVNTYTTGRQFLASATSDASGNFVVVWVSDGQDGSSYGVFGQRYDSDGNRLGSEFQVNTYTTNTQRAPFLASDASGNFVVAWSSNGQDRSLYGVFGQRYDSEGNPLGREFQVNTYTPNHQSVSSIASDASGNFVVVWTDSGGYGGPPGQDGSGSGVFGQRFSAGCNASVQVQDEFNTAGTLVPVQVHIAHGRPETVTVRWKLSLLDSSGQVVAKHISPPHTFKFGDVLEQEVNLPLPEELASGEYTLDLAVKQMAGTTGARTTLRVLRPD